MLHKYLLAPTPPHLLFPFFIPIMYRLYTALLRGAQHPFTCEDALLAETLPKHDMFIGAVCDGCSSGKESHFAATLQCKLLRKIIRTSPDFPQHESNPQIVGLWLLQQFMEQLAESQMMLCLDNTEMLATLILLVRCQNQAWISILGDGVINIDGYVQHIDQNNMPDYPAYHLSESDAEWLAYFKKQRYSTHNFQQIAIATDGISSFAGSVSDMSLHEATQYMLCNKELAQQNGMLYRKYNILQNKYRLLPTDDVAIVRLDKTAE